jgi:transketolase
MTVAQTSIDLLCINTIRTLAIDAVQKANSGHPGMPMGAAPLAYVLWARHLRHDPSDPGWVDRDRFVLSGGHGSMLLYALLYLFGYPLSLEDLQSFRQWGSKTPGHPEFGHTPGVEATTGPLGQGAANAVGMAIAERHLAARFNRPGHALVDHATYALVTDGDLMEGLSSEAASLAGHLGLGKLVYLYDANDVSLDGPLGLAFSDDVAARFAASGWHVQAVERGDTDLEAIDRAISAARAETERPSLVVVKTTIGYGSPNKAGKSEAHGAPLGPDEVRLAKERLGFDPEAEFHVPAEARAHFQAIARRGAREHAAWRARREAWASSHPELAAEWARRWQGELPADFDAGLPRFEAGVKLATRVAGGKALNALAQRVPELFGGDADLSCSTLTALNGEAAFDGRSGGGRNVHFGVREHAMGAAALGMLYHGGLRPFVATFFVFSDYMRPPLRLAALSKLPLVAVFTHDSIGVGEDGPTHQPIEHLASLRAMPNLCVLRPADGNETAAAWRVALARRDGPSALVLSRQAVPTLAHTAELGREGVARGGYVASEARGGARRIDALLLATGTEVSLAVEAQALLEAEGRSVRVVSLPSWELFAAQERSYRDSVLPPAVRARVSVEAGASFGWERWVGERGTVLGIDRFGASAPGGTNFERYGLTREAVAAAVRAALDGGTRGA